MSNACLDARSSFLALDLRNYPVGLAPSDHEYAIASALYGLATKPNLPGDGATLFSDEGCLLKTGGNARLTVLQTNPRAPQQPWFGRKPKTCNTSFGGYAFAKHIPRRSRGEGTPHLLLSKACRDRSLRGSVA